MSLRNTANAIGRLVITYLAIDYGSKRIGLAVGDERTRVAAPLRMLDATGTAAGDARAVLLAAQEYDIRAFVVGLPLNMDDSEGPQAKTTRAFGDELSRITDCPVHYWDERLSSVEARERIRPAGLSRKKRKGRVDSIAAQVMLQDFLDSPDAPGGPSGTPTTDTAE